MTVVCPLALEETLWRWFTDGVGITFGEGTFQSVVSDGKALQGKWARHGRAKVDLAVLEYEFTVL